MRIDITISKKNEYVFDYDMFLFKDDINMIIVDEDGLSIEKKLGDKQKILNYFEEQKKLYEKDPKNYLDPKIIKDKIEKYLDNLIDNIEYVKFNEGVDAKKIINNNPILCSKKIILDRYLKIGDYKVLDEITDEFSFIKDNIYVFMDKNESVVPLSKCRYIFDLIRKQADEIKLLNLSPFETVMYTYDFVRNRVYNREANNEEYSKSRDLSEIISGEKIVCVGYANYFQALLEFMNFKCEFVRLSRKRVNSGHIRNAVYIDDSKYDIKGVYYFDCTWDSKEAEDDNNYLYSYEYFARTKEFMNLKYDIQCDYIESSFPIYYNDIDDYKKDLKKNLFNSKGFDLIKSLKFIFRITNNEKLIEEKMHDGIIGEFIGEDYIKIVSKLEEVLPLFNKPISTDKLVSALCNVRFVEYQQNPKWYPCKFKDIFDTCIYSNWSFMLPPELRLLDCIKGIERSKGEVFMYHNGEKVKQLEGKRLVYTLKNVLDKKKKDV